MTSVELSVFLVFLSVAAAAGIVIRTVMRFERYRGVRCVTCPETKAPAIVQIDAMRAAVSSRVRLRTCTRWPARKDCPQDCLCQLEQSSSGCRVSEALVRWYSGKTCARCGKALHADVVMRHPAILDPRTGMTIDWRDIPSSGYPGVLELHLPVCWDCHMTETFLQRYPDLVTARGADACGSARRSPTPTH